MIPAEDFASPLSKTATLRVYTNVSITFGKVGHVYNEFSVAGGRFGVGVVETAVAVRRGRRRDAMVGGRRCGPVAVVHGGHGFFFLRVRFGATATAATARRHVLAVPFTDQISAVATITMSCTCGRKQKKKTITTDVHSTDFGS